MKTGGRFPPPDHHAHRDVTGGGLRAAVFGGMDGLVSNTALVMGVSGGGASDSTVLLAGVVGMVAGAFSMAVGEWASVQSANEVTARELELERHELARNPASEEAELAQMWQDRGLSLALAQQVAKELSSEPERALRVHAEAELGVDPSRLPRPGIAASSSFLAFMIGGTLPVLPFISGGRFALLIAVIIAAIALFGIGALVARWTSRTSVFSGVRLLVIGAVVGSVTYGLGALIGSSVT